MAPCTVFHTFQVAIKSLILRPRFDILHGRAKRTLASLLRLRMAAQCAMAVAFLHENTIMHRDIKSLNVMVRFNSVHGRNLS